MMASAEFVAKMAELSAAFTRRTAVDAGEFEAVAVALSQSDEAAHRARLQYLAHRLAGGAATFGLMVLEEPASDLESCILAKASVEEICARSLKLAQTIRRICSAKALSAEHGDGAA